MYSYLQFLYLKTRSGVPKTPLAVIKCTVPLCIVQLITFRKRLFHMHTQQQWQSDGNTAAVTRTGQNWKHLVKVPCKVNLLLSKSTAVFADFCYIHAHTVHLTIPIYLFLTHTINNHILNPFLRAHPNVTPVLDTGSVMTRNSSSLYSALLIDVRLNHGVVIVAEWHALTPIIILHIRHCHVRWETSVTTPHTHTSVGDKVFW